MKVIFLTFFSVCFALLNAQTIDEQIQKMVSLNTAEDFRTAMALGDKLIGEGVKQGYEKQAGQVYLQRGIAKFNFEIFDDAIVDFKQAVAFNTDLTDSYLYIAEIYYDLEQYSMALENIIYFLNSQPDNIHGLAVKSKCLLQIGEPTAAKIIIQQAISLVASEPELYYVRACINNALGESDKACSDAKIAKKFGYEEAESIYSAFCETDK